MNLTIEDFWKKILPLKRVGRPVGVDVELSGWTTQPDVNLEGSFIEAPLEGDPGEDLTRWSVLLVSAPGAVGKTTLAKQICAKTHSVYIDLAEAGTIGANTLSGGLVHASLYNDWAGGDLGLVVDALDEARMRVTEESFTDFLVEVKALAEKQKRPLVLFGRTGVIDDARVWLEALGVQSKSLGVVEIGFYGPEASEAFAFSVLQGIRRRHHRVAPGVIERKAIGLILAKLRHQTSSEGGRFAGYAPVLRAVAGRVDVETGNMVKFINRIQQAHDSLVALYGIGGDILERDQEKVGRLSSIRDDVREKLYSSEEQLDRLSAKLYRTPAPRLPDEMTSHEIEIYKQALDTWMAEHPFLDGDVASSAVFEAQICVHALKKHVSDTALRQQVCRGRKANPFLLELYRAATNSTDIPPEHVGIIYASVRSRLTRGERASLEVADDSADLGDGGDGIGFELTLTRGGEETSLCRGRIREGGTIRFGPDIEDVDIDAPVGLNVELGGCEGRYVSMVAPISIVCKRLSILAECVEVSGQTEAANLVYIDARELDSKMGNMPRVRHGSELAVDWHWGATAYPYPWTGYEPETETLRIDDPVLDQIHRRLRKFVVVCKAGAGEVGRAAVKLKSVRMSRGWGTKVFDALEREGVFVQDGPFYRLDPARLSFLTGLNYSDCRKGKSTNMSLAFADSVRRSG